MDFGSIVSQIIEEENLENIKIKLYGYPDEFIKHGSVQEIEKKYGLDTNSITEDVKKSLFDEEKEEMLV